MQHAELDSQLEDQQQELATVKMEPRNHNKRMIPEVPPRIKPALDVLLEAVHYAEQTSGDCWEFAVELAQLTTLGLGGLKSQSQSEGCYFWWKTSWGVLNPRLG